MASEAGSKLKDTGSKLFEDAFQNVRKAAEANLKMQQEMFGQWSALWPGFPTPQSAWVDKMQDFQKQWSNTVSDMAQKHREVVDQQYQAALESLDEALRFFEAKNPEEFRKRSEQFFRKAIDCMKEMSEAQVKEFQDRIGKWGELMAKAGN